MADDESEQSARGARVSLRAAAAILSAVIAVAGLVVAIDVLLRPGTLPVRRIAFEGPFYHVAQDELEAAVGRLRRVSWLALDLAAIKKRVQSVPWVHHVSVRRVWPDTVQIVFTEQKLIARWDDDAWLNHEGDVVMLPPDAGNEALPRLAGPSGSTREVLARYREFNELLAADGLSLASLRLSPRLAWNAVLDNGIELMLDRAPPRDRLARFARHYPALLAPHAAAIRRVDLRYTNGFAVQWKNAAAAPRAAGG